MITLDNKFSLLGKLMTFTDYLNDMSLPGFIVTNLLADKCWKEKIRKKYVNIVSDILKLYEKYK